MRLHSLILALCFGSVISACSPEKPWMMEDTLVDNSPMRIVESRHIVKKPLADMSDRDVMEAARLYTRSGAGPVYVAVAFDDTKGKGLDRDVAAHAQALAEGLARNGVTQKIIVSTVQLDAPIPVALIAFDTLIAAAPAGCEQRPDIDKAATTNQGTYDYRLGCGIKSAMAKQISNPLDLEGRAGVGPADAERLSNIINNDYRTGEPNEFLPSYVISELAASQ